MSFVVQPTVEGDVLLAEKEPFLLESGESLQPINLRYSIYGDLERSRDNVILVCHALSGSSRVGEWWSGLFGTGRPFDLGRCCVIGINVLGSCYGSTGPASVNPKTGKPFGPDFPTVSIADMVRAQALVLDHLGVETLSAAIGGSIGGMQALQWAVDYPHRVRSAIAIGATPLSAMGLALNHIQRLAIQGDPLWNEGRYPVDTPPSTGLGIARALAMCSYKSADLFSARFGRRPDRSGEQPHLATEGRYDVAGYLDYQRDEFNGRFDANTYITISKAMDTFEFARNHGSDEEAFRKINAKVLMIGISSDWLFPAVDVESLATHMRNAGVRSRYAEQVSSHGHDAFLADTNDLSALIMTHQKWLEGSATPGITTPSQPTTNYLAANQ